MMKVVGFFVFVECLVEGMFMYCFGLEVVCGLFGQLMWFIVIFVSNDDMVVGVIVVVYGMWFCLLEDFVICGFDDIFVVIMVWFEFMMICQLIVDMVWSVIDMFIEQIC